MITAEEREDAFREDLRSLLLKHGAMLDMTLEAEPYSDVEYPTLEVTMCAIRDDNEVDIKKEYAYLTLGNNDL